jgi:uncharacterized protein (UPF0332 family)
VGLAQDLLQQADHLAAYEGANHTQVALRRAVSTAYYALFHLLIADAATRWQGSPAANTGLERGFQHGPMKDISKRFGNPSWKDWHGNSRSIPSALQQVAHAFVELQDERHTANYNSYEQWSLAEVQATLNTAHAAFRNWQSIRSDAVAGDYLLMMLLQKQRS